jgi:nitrate reductase gamma subunit
MIEFIKGPMVWIAFGMFFAGLVFQGFRFFRLTRRKERRLIPAPPKKAGNKQTKKNVPVPTREGMWIQHLFWWVERKFAPLTRLAEKRIFPMRNSVAGTHPIVTGVTVIFHVFLFATPIFLLAHNELVASALGFSLPSLADSTTDMMTMVFLACAAFFLLRRIFVHRVRAISSVFDYFAWLITVVPFVTGFLAYHQFFDYDKMLTVHIILGEIMLILVPFTKLGHMIYFFLYRFFIGSEYSFGQGSRAW